MNTFIKRSILALTIISNFAISAELSVSDRCKKYLGSALTYCFTSKVEPTAEFQKYTTDLAQQADSPVPIHNLQHFNALGTFIFGKGNSLTIPFCNTLVYDKEFMEKLPEECKRFVIGRSIEICRQPATYSFFKYVYPYAMYTLTNSGCNYIESQVNPNNNSFIKQQIFLAGKALIALWSYNKYSIFFEGYFDKRAITNFNCKEGAEALNTFLDKQPIQKSISNFLSFQLLLFAIGIVIGCKEYPKTDAFRKLNHEFMQAKTVADAMIDAGLKPDSNQLQKAAYNLIMGFTENTSIFKILGMHLQYLLYKTVLPPGQIASSNFFAAPKINLPVKA